MKTYKNLYKQIYDFENLYQAYLNARRNKRFREGVLRFSANLEENLIDLQNNLIYQTYKVGEYRERIVHIPKKRIIMILPFRDRVLQWAIYRIINPLFERSFIPTSYGCIKGRGGLRAVQKLQYWLRLTDKEPEKHYALQMDIKKYFFRIPHDILLGILREKVADDRVMWLFDTIINDPQKAFGLPPNVVSLENAERLWGIGMPVGNLTSQMLANIVLDKVDQYIKRVLRVKYYIRYNDNMLIIGKDKQELHRIEAQVGRFIHENLCLEFSATSIQPTHSGITFVGYRIWSDKLILRKPTSLRMKQRLKTVQHLYGSGTIPLEKALSSISSYLGMMSHCTNTCLRDKVLEDFVLVRHSQNYDIYSELCCYELLSEAYDSSYMLLDDLPESEGDWIAGIYNMLVSGSYVPGLDPDCDTTVLAAIGIALKRRRLKPGEADKKTRNIISCLTLT